MNQKAVMAMTPRNWATSRGHCGRGTRLWLMDRVGGGRLLRRRHANGGNHQEENDEKDGQLEERLLQAPTGSHEGAALKAAHPFSLHLEQDDRDEGYRDQYLGDVEVISQCHLQIFGLLGATSPPGRRRASCPAQRPRPAAGCGRRRCGAGSGPASWSRGSSGCSR